MVRKLTAVVTTKPLCNCMLAQSETSWPMLGRILTVLQCWLCLDDGCDDIYHQSADRAGDGVLGHHLETMCAFPAAFASCAVRGAKRSGHY